MDMTKNNVKKLKLGVATCAVGFALLGAGNGTVHAQESTKALSPVLTTGMSNNVISFADSLKVVGMQITESEKVKKFKEEIIQTIKEGEEYMEYNYLIDDSIKYLRDHLNTTLNNRLNAEDATNYLRKDLEKLKHEIKMEKERDLRLITIQIIKEIWCIASNYVRGLF
ncbi:hypothetical protein [Atopobacter phocae]|uniref:hypothetical protein n=1 Tax=Atopobacter phocae TaxID=136492 RepID=UPI00047231F2|nr:hypothetical protein [Atopobacter phocae]